MNEHLDNVEQRLALLAKEKRTAFAAVIANRMLPFYLDCQGDDWCKPDTVKKTFEMIWQVAEKKKLFTDTEIYDHLDELIRASPDMDECNEYYALDFCSTLGFAFETCLSTSTAAVAASAAYCALENLARRSNYPEPELAKDPAIRNEMRKQLELLDYLEKSPGLNFDQLKET
jgi:uncharacterized protein YjaG (DUF416 family)